VCSEDEITSIVFGPLDFLPASDHWLLWKTVLHNHASMHASGLLPLDFLSGFSPVECILDFWPRKSGVEPDLVITFTSAQGETRSLLIELKWNAGVSGDDQLHRQWSEYQAGLHATSLHVFIAKRMSDLPDDRQGWLAPGRAGMRASRLRAVRWHELQHEIAKLAALSGTPVALARWCELTSGFLHQVGIRAFAGFHASKRLASALARPELAQARFWSWPADNGTTSKETP
jgi:hypothetical protein